MVPEPAAGLERVKSGAKVHLHQAFKCCPYAGAVTSQIHDFLEKNGYTVMRGPEGADVHVINSCGSDARLAQMTFDAIERIGTRSQETAPVVVTGCLCGIERARLETALA